MSLIPHMLDQLLLLLAKQLALLIQASQAAIPNESYVKRSAQTSQRAIQADEIVVGYDVPHAGVFYGCHMDLYVMLILCEIHGGKG